VWWQRWAWGVASAEICPDCKHNGGMKMNSSPQMAGHVLVQCLIEQGVSHVFGVPGESFLPLLDGFYQFRERIRLIVNRHEGGAAFMAEAQGKLTRRPGVCLVTRGPGATNASIGLHTAFQDSTPMVLLVGDVASGHRDREAFQEVDYLSFFGPSTKAMAKRVERIDDAQRIPEYVARAFATAMNGRPGPVVLVLPADLLSQMVNVPVRADGSFCTVGQLTAAESHLGRLTLSAIREKLLKATQPLAIVGGTGWTPQAAQAWQRFAEKWQLPVANAFRFQDTFDNHHPLYAGDVGLGINPKLAARIQQADLILALGVRLGEITTGGYTLLQSPQPNQTLLHIHPGAEELNRVFHAEMALQASVPNAAQALLAVEPPSAIAWTAWAQDCHADYEAFVQPRALTGLAADTEHGVAQLGTLVATLNQHLPADAILTNGAGNYAAWLHRYFRYHGLVQGGRTQLAPTNGAMGYGVPAGVAAALLTGRTVFTLTGDGDFLMNGQELATAVQYGAKSIVVLFNNGMLGTIRMHQEREYPQRVSGTVLRNPDFVALAQAYGYEGVRVSREQEFEPALLAALARPQGSLIEVMQEPQALSPRASLNEITQAALSRLLEQR